jgi:hypothetical protein
MQNMDENIYFISNIKFLYCISITQKINNAQIDKCFKKHFVSKALPLSCFKFPGLLEKPAGMFKTGFSGKICFMKQRLFNCKCSFLGAKKLIIVQL